MPGQQPTCLLLIKPDVSKKIKVLSSSFNEQTELMLINYLEDYILPKKATRKNEVRLKGTLQISMGACIGARDTKD